ncbi:MAG: cobalamin-binding protein [Burkholderiales bacterium]|nr:cobalamin-binding protein [Burkholderiales bacterium]
MRRWAPWLLLCMLGAGAVHAQRIVTLAPALTELVYAAGAGSKLVAVSAWSNYPPAATNLPVVADHAAVNREALLALKPDVVLAWKTGTPERMMASVRSLGISVRLIDGQRIDDVPRLLREIGEIAGTSSAADNAATAYEIRLANIRKRYASLDSVPALIEIWHAPFMSVSGAHYMSDALVACGGRNVLADLPGITPEVSMERIVEIDPAAIVGAGSADSPARFKDNWKRFTSLKAVRQDALIWLEPDTIQRQTPRLLDGVESLCQQLARTRK